jgi:hypothetical protein
MSALLPELRRLQQVAIVFSTVDPGSAIAFAVAPEQSTTEDHQCKLGNGLPDYLQPAPLRFC